MPIKLGPDWQKMAEAQKVELTEQQLQRCVAHAASRACIEVPAAARPRQLANLEPERVEVRGEHGVHGLLSTRVERRRFLSAQGFEQRQELVAAPAHFLEHASRIDGGRQAGHLRMSSGKGNDKATSIVANRPGLT